MNIMKRATKRQRSALADTRRAGGTRLIGLSLLSVIVGCLSDVPLSKGRERPRPERKVYTAADYQATFGKAQATASNAAVATPNAAPAGPVAGSTPGQFSLTDNGAATYTIPLEVPPGRAGLSPHLSLTYHSDNNQNGILGVGFTLGGLSAITRCPKSVAIDGVSGAVQNDENDRFCLDGQPLVALPGETYGGDGTEYRTVPDTFAKIKSYRSPEDPGGPTRFTVWSKSGERLEYGGRRSIDSPGAGQSLEINERNVYARRDLGVVQQWSLGRVVDRNSYAVEFNYTSTLVTKSQGSTSPEGITHTDDQRLSSIVYGLRGGEESGASDPRSNGVGFEYEERPDPVEKFVAGSALHSSKRLKRVSAYAEGQTKFVRSYSLAYDTGLTLRSRLRSVTECDGVGACKPAVNIAWQQDASGFIYDSAIIFPRNIDLYGASANYVDVDFDGIPDVVLLARNFELNRNEWHVARSGSTLPWLPEVWGTSDTGGAPATLNVVPIDYNRYNDGTDFAILDGSPTWRVQRSYNGTFGEIIDTGVPSALGESPANAAVFVDLDGDGVEDLLECRFDGTNYNYSARFRGAAGNDVEAVPIFSSSFVSQSCEQMSARQPLVDSDGDGIVEIVRVDKEEADDWSITPATVSFLSWRKNEGQFGGWVKGKQGSFGAMTFPNALPFPNGRGWLPALRGDINGDGYVDTFGDNFESGISNGIDGNGYVILNKGGLGYISGSGPNGNYPSFYFADFVEVEPGTVQPLLPTEYYKNLVVDYDGDGADDVLRYRNSDTGESFGLSVHRYKHGINNESVKFSLPQLSELRHKISGVGDFNGDGAADIATVNEDWTVRFFKNQAVNNDTVVEVHEGSYGQPDFVRRVRIEYGAAYNRYYAKDSPAFGEQPLYTSTHRTNAPDCEHPVKCVNGPMRVVSRFLDNDWEGGISPASSSNEHVVYYDDARYDVRLRQWLGFAQRTVIERPTNHDDLITNISRTSVTRYDNRTYDASRGVYPNLGKVISSDVFSSHSPDVRQTYNEWELRQGSADGPSVYFSYVKSQRVERNFYANGFSAWSVAFPSHVGSESRTDVSSVDAYGNTEVVTTGAAGTSSFGWRIFRNDPASWVIGRLTSEISCVTERGESQCREAAWDYDADGRIKSTTTAKGDARLQLTVTFGRDDWGNIDSVEARDDATGEVRLSSVTYEPNGYFPFAVTNALGQTTLVNYERAHGNLVELVDYNQRHASWQYDGFGALTREDRADGTHTQIERLREVPAPFGPVRTKVWSTTPGVSKAGVEYNFTGRPVARYAYGYFDTPSVQHLGYDQYGEHVNSTTLPHELSMLAANWQTASTEVDPLGRVRNQVDPDGSSVVYEYDPYSDLGDSIVTTDRRGFKYRHESDRLGRPRRTEDPLGAFLEYAYGRESTVLKGDIGAGNAIVVRRVVRDSYGHVVEIFDADAGTRKYAYNAFGELVTYTNARGQVTTYDYDGLGRMTHRIEPEGTATWVWDTAPNGVGRLQSSTSSQGVVETYHYDALGRAERVDTTVDDETFSVSFSYDSFGRLQYVKYPEWSSGQALELEQVYDDTGHVFEIRNRSGGGTPIWSAIATDEVGRVTLDALENGTDTVRVYDPATLRLGEQRTRAFGTDRLVRRYGYDKNGNLTLREEREGTGPARVEEFTYDAANRLTEATPLYNLAATRTYEYTKTGNLKRKSDVGDYVYNDPAHPHAVTGAGPHGFAYDASGNQTSRPGLNIDYTSFDKPLTYRDPSGVTTAEFVYGSGRERVVKRVGALETTYVQGLYERVLNVESNTVEHKYYVPSPMGVVAVFSYSGPAGGVAGSSLTKRFLHTDHLGSVDLVTDASGAVVERRSYDAFGQRRDPQTAQSLPPSTPFIVSLGFTHHEQGDEFGLINMQGRIYDPLTGRFLSADPIVSAPGLVQSWNRYSYVINNPLSLTDPSGYDWCIFSCEGGSPPGGPDGGGGGGGETGPGPSYPREPEGDNGGVRSQYDYPPTRTGTPRRVGVYAPPPPPAALQGDSREALTAEMARASARGVSKHAASTGFYVMPIETVGQGFGPCCNKLNLLSGSADYDALWGMDKPPAPLFSEGDKNAMARAAFSFLPGMNTLLTFRDPSAGPWQKAFAVVMDAASVVTFGVGTVLSTGAKGAIGLVAKTAPRAYSVAFEARLTARGIGTYPAHFAEANEQLLRAMKDPDMATALKGTLGTHFEGSLISPSGSGRVLGSSPPGWTWHHVADQPGVLHLVPRTQHAPGSVWQPLLHPNGEGGMSIWGSRF